MLPIPLQKLLQQAIDYAGVFPPARLPLSSAVEEFVQLITSDKRWILRGFVVPAENVPRLEEFVPVLQSHRVCLPLVVIARSPADDGERRRLWKEDQDALRALRADYPDTFSLIGWETKLPLSLLNDPRLPEIISELEKPRNSLFLEIPLQQLTPEQLEHFFSVLKSGNGAGVKIRTGGEEASAFPPVEEVARALALGALQGVRLKATAGLHHALRWYDEERGIWQYGFFNILFAFAYAKKYYADAGNTSPDKKKKGLEDIEAILKTTQWEDFSFQENAIVWKGVPLDITDIDSARRLFVSFGSCSVDEPLEDLQKLALRTTA